MCLTKPKNPRLSVIDHYSYIAFSKSGVIRRLADSLQISAKRTDQPLAHNHGDKSGWRIYCLRRKFVNKKCIKNLSKIGWRWKEARFSNVASPPAISGGLLANFRLRRASETVDLRQRTDQPLAYNHPDLSGWRIFGLRRKFVI